MKNQCVDYVINIHNNTTFYTSKTRSFAIVANLSIQTRICFERVAIHNIFYRIFEMYISDKWLGFIQMPSSFRWFFCLKGFRIIRFSQLIICISLLYQTMCESCNYYVKLYNISGFKNKNFVID